MTAALDHIDQITPQWLTQILFPAGEDEIVSTNQEPIGHGLVGSANRVRFETANGKSGSVVAKLSSEDEGVRSAASRLGLYEREVRVYQLITPRTDIRVPHCHFAAIDESGKVSTLILEDLAGLIPGDQIVGIDPDLAGDCVDQLAILHATWWADDWLSQQTWPAQRTRAWAEGLSDRFALALTRFRETLAPSLDSDQVDLVEGFAAVIEDFYADNDHRPKTLIHHDFRPDNLLFTNEGKVMTIDFQTMSWAPAAVDLAYFLQSGMTIENRRQHEDRLVRRYHSNLVAAGVDGYDLETCWNEYRRQVFAGITIVLLALVSADDTDRGRRMIVQWADRLTRAGLDLGSTPLG